MKLAVIIKILQITGMRISTAQHYSVSDIKGRFSFYCVCSRLEEEQEEEARERKQGRRDARLRALGEIKRAERTENGGGESGDTELSDVFAATNGCSCIVSIWLNWPPV